MLRLATNPAMHALQLGIIRRPARPFGLTAYSAGILAYVRNFYSASSGTPQRAFAHTPAHADSADEEQDATGDATSAALLTELRDALRAFVRAEITPEKATAIDEAGHIPRSLWRGLGELGALGVTAPPAYGGLGLGHAAHCTLVREISRSSASVGLSYAAHSNICMRQIVVHGSNRQQEKFLPGMIDGSVVGALAMSESGAGSDVVGSMKARATRQLGHKKGWLLNGNKMWITNGPCADVFIVYAKTASEHDSEPRQHDKDAPAGAHKEDSITAFILERNMPGFTTAQKLDKLGMRGSETCELVFSDVYIPDENVLGRVGAGVYILMSGLDSERLVLSAAPLGIMDACMDVAVPYIRTRVQFGKPIGEFQLMQAKIADMYTMLRATEALVGSTAVEMDMNDRSKASVPSSTRGNAAISKQRRDCAASILFAAENATQMALQTIQTLGGNGYINEYPAARLLRDAKLYEIGAGTSEIRRLLVGRELYRDESFPSI